MVAKQNLTLSDSLYICGMIEFGKITGKVDGTKIQVKFRQGECLYAPIVTIGVGISLPSEKWIKDNKDSFLALVAFEKNLPENPAVIGFYPVKGAKSEDYSVTEKTLKVLLTLIEKLMNGKVNTQLGPQPFMPDTQQALSQLKQDVKDIQELINPVDL